jgi:hypothetical protein
MPNTDTSAIRTSTRRIKTHIANKYLKLADRVDAKGEGDLSDKEYEKYWEMTKEFARNVVPRSQEVTGEDGQPLIVQVAKSIADKNAINDSPEPNSGEPSSV